MCSRNKKDSDRILQKGCGLICLKSLVSLGLSRVQIIFYGFGKKEQSHNLSNMVRKEYRRIIKDHFLELDVVWDKVNNKSCMSLSHHEASL